MNNNVHQKLRPLELPEREEIIEFIVSKSIVPTNAEVKKS